MKYSSVFMSESVLRVFKSVTIEYFYEYMYPWRNNGSSSHFRNYDSIYGNSVLLLRQRKQASLLLSVILSCEVRCVFCCALWKPVGFHKPSFQSKWYNSKSLTFHSNQEFVGQFKMFRVTQ